MQRLTRFTLDSNPVSQKRGYLPGQLIFFLFEVVADDIAEEIVWAASRPPHVNIAEVFVLPVNQASAGIVYREPKKQ